MYKKKIILCILHRHKALPGANFVAPRFFGRLSGDVGAGLGDLRHRLLRMGARPQAQHGTVHAPEDTVARVAAQPTTKTATAGG